MIDTPATLNATTLKRALARLAAATGRRADLLVTVAVNGPTLSVTGRYQQAVWHETLPLPAGHDTPDVSATMHASTLASLLRAAPARADLTIVPGAAPNTLSLRTLTPRGPLRITPAPYAPATPAPEAEEEAGRAAYECAAGPLAAALLAALSAAEPAGHFAPYSCVHVAPAPAGGALVYGTRGTVLTAAPLSAEQRGEYEEGGRVLTMPAALAAPLAAHLRTLPPAAPVTLSGRTDDGMHAMTVRTPHLTAAGRERAVNHLAPAALDLLALPITPVVTTTAADLQGALRTLLTLSLTDGPAHTDMMPSASGALLTLSGARGSASAALRAESATPEEPRPYSWRLGLRDFAAAAAPHAGPLTLGTSQRGSVRLLHLTSGQGALMSVMTMNREPELSGSYA